MTSDVKELVLSAEARNDLDRVLAFLLSSAPHAAEKAIEAIVAGCNTLCQFPELGAALMAKRHRCAIRFGKGA